MPWSITSRRPILAAGWISIPVSQRPICEENRAQQAQFMLPQPVRQAMPHDGMQTGIAEQDLQRGTRSRVAFPVGLDRLTQEHESHATIPLWKFAPHYPIVAALWVVKPNARARPVGGPNRWVEEKDPCGTIAAPRRLDIPTPQVKNSRGTENRGLCYYSNMDPPGARGRAVVIFWGCGDRRQEDAQPDTARHDRKTVSGTPCQR